MKPKESNSDSHRSFRRPTNEMMYAVNALIDGDDKLADKLVAEHKLDREELLKRREKRDGERYTFTRKPRTSKGTSEAKIATPDNIFTLLDGRTKTVTLLRLQQRIHDLLIARPTAEVAKIKDALSNYDKKKDELSEMQRLLGL